jgi:hypothetical protein
MYQTPLGRIFTCMNPWGYIAVGVGAGILGGIALSVGGAMLLLGLVLLAVAGISTLIGVIAEGVRVGQRESDAGRLRDLVDREA